MVNAVGADIPSGECAARWAELFTYPTGDDLAGKLARTAELVEGFSPEAADSLRRVIPVLERTSLARLQELYAGTFDLQPKCCPYAGYHLFGESYRRGEFMVRLKALYRRRGFLPRDGTPDDEGAMPDNELPDHLVVLLRYLAHVDFEDEILLEECLIPALRRMVAAFRTFGENPYPMLLRTLLTFLTAISPSRGAVADEIAALTSTAAGDNRYDPCSAAGCGLPPGMGKGSMPRPFGHAGRARVRSGRA